ncbi:hypothetical protein [Solobacterium moorei]
MLKSRVTMIVLLVIWYIVFPFMLVDTGSAIYLLLLINPILSIVSGLIYGKLQGFDWLILWFVAFLFIPVIYFRMDGQWDCMIYPGIYSILMSLGMVVGKMFQKKQVV